MSMPRSCPHCHKQIPLDRKFHFDESMNMVCGFCGKIIFATVESADSTNSGSNSSANTAQDFNYGYAGNQQHRYYGPDARGHDPMMPHE
jgi:hypothetical protein